MIDIITSTGNKRNEMLSYIKSKVSSDSYIWARNLISDITKKVMALKDDEFTIKVYPLYKNFKRFYTDVCTEVTPGCILLTLYIVAIELGLREVGDSVEQLPEFVDAIDMDDWDRMSYDTAISFDLYVESCIVANRFGAGDNEIFACGLHTFGLLDFILAE